MDSKGKDSSLHLSSVPMSNVTLSHCLIFLDVCLLTCKNKIENDLSIMPDIMSAIELYKLEAQ